MAARVSKILSFIFFLFLLLPLLPHAMFDEPKDEKPSAFDFLKHLQGCHKGDKVKGLHDLQLYLKEFGYLNDHRSENQTQANDENFDDSLESAIKTYQLNYHLNTTGDLDAQTISKMMVPRCGVPDISNDSNWMLKGKKSDHHVHGSRSFHVVSHYSFFRGMPRWPPSKTRLTYSIFPDSPHDAKRAVARAFRKWASVTHFRFARTRNYELADIEISFERGDHGDGWPFTGSGGSLAHAFQPTIGVFHYDADEPWSLGAVPGSFDLETVALHEIGHLLGLEHSSIEGAVMYPAIVAGTTKDLHAVMQMILKVLKLCIMFEEYSYGWIDVVCSVDVFDHFLTHLVQNNEKKIKH